MTKTDGPPAPPNPFSNGGSREPDIRLSWGRSFERKLVLASNRAPTAQYRSVLAIPTYPALLPQAKDFGRSHVITVLTDTVVVNLRCEWRRTIAPADDLTAAVAVWITKAIQRLNSELCGGPSQACVPVPCAAGA